MGLAILCSGGDAPGMNAAIKKFVDYLQKRGETPYLIYDGLEGLIDGRIKKAAHEDVAGILHRGGSVIRSSRSKRFYEYAYRQQAYTNLKKHGIEGLVVLGGDGSFCAMARFCGEFPVRVVGIPTTIDNDIYGTDYALGVDTALNTIRDALDKIYDTASSFNRAFVVEVMGHQSGYLTALSAIASGAEICVIPEKEFQISLAQERLKKEISQGRRYILALVAEGTGRTEEIARWIEKSLHFETRVTILGHIQRGGVPTSYDRMMAFEFAVMAVDYLLDHPTSNVVTVFYEGQFALKKIEEVANKRAPLQQKYIAMLDRLD